MADITTDALTSALTSGDLRSGSLEVRLAETTAEVQAAQALRYRVFYEEMGACPTAEMAALKRDFDHFDDLCDHLLVIDNSRGSGAAGVVGTYRLIRRTAAARVGTFYSSDEYDISRIEEYPGEVLELGRSCVDIAFRNRPSMQLLWRGIAAYAVMYDIRLMFGCASLPGTDPRTLAAPLSYLYYHHLAPPALRPVALPHRYVDMRMLDEQAINPRQALNELPPLIKGYLRLGGFVGEGAVVDHQFHTTDVSIVVKTDLITDKYLRHYERRGTALI
ncbi:GNAT family N-acetyltransferase [Rhodocista pekingensis]|uniref:L-ornithine N(alpha)-acyltransferase n=1 Tax=Rhodocista pekingensis TaxID=201185 RepID=A0ABW2L0L0_9PROT